MSHDVTEYISAAEALKHFDVSRSTLFRHAKEGKLRKSKDLYYVGDMIQLYQARQSKPVQETPSDTDMRHQDEIIDMLKAENARLLSMIEMLQTQVTLFQKECMELRLMLQKEQDRNAAYAEKLLALPVGKSRSKSASASTQTRGSDGRFTKKAPVPEMTQVQLLDD